MTELKPCPFCGGCGHVYEDGRLSIKPYNFPKWYITCKKCGVKTPTAKIEQVVRIWNRRVNDDAMDMAIEALKCSETPKSSEQNAETAQADHIADTGRKVEQTGETAQNVQNEDLISRKWLMECIEEGWVKFDTAKDCNRMMHLVRDIAPSVQPEPKWIPASERLPKEGQKCLVCDKGSIGIDAYTGHGNPYNWKWYTRDYEAWQPLPEPYKGGDSE